MIESLYIDNYKCFENTEVDLRSFNLLLGNNGTGKSALFEVLRLLKALVIDEKNWTLYFLQRPSLAGNADRRKPSRYRSAEMEEATSIDSKWSTTANGICGV